MTVLSRWQGMCRQSGVAPLRLVSFLPQDNINNDESLPTAGSSHRDGLSNKTGDSNANSFGGNAKSSHETLVRANAELGKCLAMSFPAFLSFVLEDASLIKFVDTFLRYRRNILQY